MDAIAPAALALSVMFDVVGTLALLLMSYEGGTVWQAIFPHTGDQHLDIAASLGDVMLLTLLRGCTVMLSLLGITAALSRLGVALSAVVQAGMTSWLIVKAVFLYQLAQGYKLLVEDTGITIHVPTLMAAELLGVFMCWFLLALVWVNRRVMQQPAANFQSVAITGSGVQRRQQLQQRLAVQQWVSTAQLPETVGSEITAPLLPRAAAEQPVAAAAVVGASNEDDGASGFFSARSRAASGSIASTGSNLEV